MPTELLTHLSAVYVGKTDTGLPKSIVFNVWDISTIACQRTWSIESWLLWNVVTSATSAVFGDEILPAREGLSEARFASMRDIL